MKAPKIGDMIYFVDYQDNGHIKSMGIVDYVSVVDNEIKIWFAVPSDVDDGYEDIVYLDSEENFCEETQRWIRD